MGAKSVLFEDIEVGSQIPPRVKNITHRQLFMYSAATWDFQPAHYDRDTARSHGFKDVYLDGPMNASFMAQLITDWVGMSGSLRQLGLTYRAMVFPGDTLTCTGKVAAKYLREDTQFIECELRLQNQDGVTVALGEATVVLWS